MKDDAVTDLTRGVYRRLYSGFTTGQRINRLSLQAEAWFWRILVTVDDFGNGHADPELCHAKTAGRRLSKITPKQVSGWLREMKEAGLIEFYEAKGEPYLHVVGFEDSQPAGRNGKRIKRFPSLGESGCVRVNPDLSSSDVLSENTTDTENTNEDDNENTSRAATALSIFNFWKTECGHETASFTPKRKRRVLERLKQGYPPERIQLAIRGCVASPFHQGQNDSGTKYDDLELICRDGEHLEKFIAIYESGGQRNGNGKPSASAQRVNQLKSNIEFIRSAGRAVNR
jgi:hypothetical protein